MAILSEEQFSIVVRLTPLVSIDLVIRNIAGRILVGCRTNEPAKGSYFVPGGVVRKNEHLDAAFARILLAETGIVGLRSNGRFLGVFEHIYDSNRREEEGYGTHYVVLAYEIAAPQDAAPEPDEQHSELRWMSREELTNDSQVHINTKRYTDFL